MLSDHWRAENKPAPLPIGITGVITDPTGRTRLRCVGWIPPRDPALTEAELYAAYGVDVAEVSCG